MELSSNTKNILNFTFMVHDDIISMILLSPNDNIGNFMHIINKWLFYSDNKYFVSILKNDNEVNILLSSDLIDTSIDNMIRYKRYNRNYKIIQIMEGYNIVSVSGIIHTLTGLFANENIPILFSSTYVNDYIFVEEDYIDMAVKILVDNGLRNFKE